MKWSISSSEKQKGITLHQLLFGYRTPANGSGKKVRWVKGRNGQYRAYYFAKGLFGEGGFSDGTLQQVARGVYRVHPEYRARLESILKQLGVRHEWLSD